MWYLSVRVDNPPSVTTYGPFQTWQQAADRMRQYQEMTELVSIKTPHHYRIYEEVTIF